MITENQLLSKVILLLRFPLIVCIVMLHVELPVQSGVFPIYDSVRFCMRDGIGNLGVPLFFFISGLLFFYYGDFNLNIYKNKMKKRLKTLVLPYILWNLLFMGASLFVQLFIPTLNNQKLLKDYSLIEFLDSFWHYNGIAYDCPIHSHLWFLRDLIVMSFFSPLIYFIHKYTKFGGIVILTICYVIGIKTGITGLGVKSWLFFGLGTYFGVNKFNVAKLSYLYIKPLLIISSILFFLTYIVYYNHLQLYYIQRIYYVVSIFTVFGIVAFIVSKHSDISSKFAEYSFFVYVFHGFIISPLNQLYSSIIPLNTITCILSLFVVTFVATVISIFFYIFLKRFAPKALSLSVGGR